MLARRVEEIVTAQPDFAGHAGLQDQRAVAGEYVAYAASRLGGEPARDAAFDAALRVQRIRNARQWSNPEPFERRWIDVSGHLSKFGIGLAAGAQLKFGWDRPIGGGSDMDQKDTSRT